MEPFGSGTYRFDCTVNGIGMKMLFDTGASSVSLSLTTAKYLIENGYLEVRDIKGHSYSQIADGSTVPKLNAIINDIGIGSVHIKNVAASIVLSENAALLLLGMSVIQSLGNKHWMAPVSPSKRQTTQKLTYKSYRKMPISLSTQATILLP